MSAVLLSLSPLMTALSFGEVPREVPREVSKDENNRTILLDASAIQGERLGKEADMPLRQKRTDLPALSTALRWEGNDIIALDIPKEILDQLTQPDLSYILEQSSDLEEID